MQVWNRPGEKIVTHLVRADSPARWANDEDLDSLEVCSLWGPTSSGRDVLRTIVGHSTSSVEDCCCFTPAFRGLDLV